MWGMAGTTIYRLNLSTGAVSTFAAPSAVKSGNFGAAWTFNNGNVGFSNNQTGDIYQISITNPTGTPTFGLVSNYTGPVAGQSNDGAACVAPLTVDLGITKTGPALVSPSGTITWTLTVTNSGPGNSSGFAVSDTVPSGVTNVTSPTSGCKVTGNSVLCSEGALTNGSSFTITLVGTAPSTNGTCFTNSATVTGNESDPNSGNNSSSVQTCTTPAITIVKSANVGSVSAPGTVVTYSYLVTNTSTTTILNHVGVTDPMSGLSSITCPASELAAGQSMTCTATYTTTQTDIDRGSITNTGTATGTPPSGSAVTATSSVTIPVTQSPAITVVKSASITGYSAPGVSVTYSYKLTNTGNVTLTSVGVTDPMSGLSAVSCPNSTLAPGAGETCTATYKTTQADVDNGSITNTGTATGTAPSGTKVTAASTVTIKGTQTPGISLLKSASISSFSAPGTAVTYSYKVTNTGNVTLTSVGVTDPMAGLSAITCPSPSLAPGASETCTATYTTTQANVDAGSVHNTGTASGTPPSGTAITAQSSVTIPATQSPGITMVKSSDIPSFSGISAPGVVITYSYAVTNTGNVSLHAVNVTDPMPGLSSVNCPTSTLAPGASETCTATYTTTQADVDRGSITNTGTATGTPPTGSALTSQSSLTIKSIQTPAIGIVKSANIQRYSAPATLVTYSYLVTNSGNSTLTSVGVTDPMSGLSAVTCPTTTLAPGISETCTATYTTTQADVDRGSITNTGTATGTAPGGSKVTDSSKVTLPASQSPAITLTKSASITSFSAPGVHVTYSYKVTNTGNVTLTSVGVTDPMTGLSAITCSTTTLPPGASETCTASYTTTQADVDNGSISNTGTASGTPPTGSHVTAPSSLSIPSVQTPVITLAKSASVPSFSTVGRVITYSYKVTNSGNVTFNPVTVSDPMTGLSLISCPSTILGPSATETCTATYTTTQTDLDTGSISNTGTAAGTPPSGPPATAQSSVTVPATQTPTIALVKSASIPSFSAQGTVITYSYKVTNSGNVTLNPVTVTDPMTGLSAITCPTTILAPAAAETCTATYTTTQTDLDKGSVSNTGTAAGTPPIGPPATAQSSVTVPGRQTPAITLVKTSNLTSFAAAGLLITYSYKVTNSGNVTLNPVTVTDPMTGLSAITCPTTILAPAAAETCLATYTTTSADIDAGQITNTGTATGKPPTGSSVTSTSSVLIPAVQVPAIGLMKTANVPQFSEPGTVITYSYAVTNSGNSTLHAITVTDPMPGLSTIFCASATLDAGASETCTATYTTTQADVDRGSITNTGTATGKSPQGQTVSNTSTVTVPAVQTPGISLLKSADTPSFSSPGTTITYHYLATNTGNVTLNPVTVSDPMPNLSAITCPQTALTPGAFENCTATYATTQADVNFGSVTNTGTATGTPPIGPPVTAQSTVTVPAVQDPGIGVVKSANVSSFDAPGVVIAYSYQVSNIGNETLTAVNVTDPMPNLSPVNCPQPTLAPGASETCTATYTTTQADVNAPSGITNTGTATGTPPSGPNVTDHSTLTVPSQQVLALTLVKTASVPSFSAPGQEIVYSYLLTNTGNVTLSDPSVTDPMPGLSAISCPLTPLDPGDQLTCTATYKTTQTDLDRGSITNTGTATATPPSGPPPVSAASTVTVPATLNPQIALAKTSSPQSFTLAGTLITYTYNIINAGNVTLHAVSLTDPMIGLSAISCPLTILAPGASENCTATYTTTQADVDRGQIVNTASVFGTSPLGQTVNDQASLTLPAIEKPGIDLVKLASVPTFSGAGTTITYSYVVSNTGNVTLAPVTVTDPMVGLSAITCPDPSLAPNEAETCTATYTTTQADVDDGSITNTGTATGTPPRGLVVTAQSTLTIPANQTPHIGLAKSANPTSFSSPGTVITYSYQVTNSGNVTLHAVAVTDPLPGLSAVSCPDSTLLAGAAETCTATYTTTQADVDRGSILNTGTATGTPPSGPAVTAQSTVIVAATQTRAVTLTKSGSPSFFGTVGATITYFYLVTNTGNVTLSPVVVTDPMPNLSTIDCGGTTSLAPGASETCTATYSTTQADLDRGRIINTGTVTATPPSGPALTRQSSATVLATQVPAIHLVKSASILGFSAAGTPVVYDYAVTNSGNVTLQSVGVTDPMLGLSAVSCPSSTLAPNATETCTATYTTTQTDVDNGSLNNTGTATGTPPIGPAITSSASLRIPATQSPAITLKKQASITSYAAPNTAVTYSYTVDNTGNVTLDPVTVTDPMSGLSAITCPDSELSPNQVETCTATYTTTQADVDRGSVNNMGTASGTPPSGLPVVATSSVTIPAVESPGISLVKSSDLSTFSTAGTLVIYSYLVTNTGNQTLTSVGVTDPMPGLSSVSCPEGTLAPGSSEACTASYTITQTDVDNGSITNTGTASGISPGGTNVTAQSTLTITLAQAPGIALSKSASISSYSTPGTLITYSYLVTNAGNVTLHSISVADPQPGLSSPIDCPDSALTPGESETCTATYTTTQTDVDNGSITNTGTATGTPPTGPPLTDQSTLTVDAVQNAGIALVKSASVPSYAAAGTVITYSYLVTNTGNVTLTSVHITDPLPNLSPITCPITPLAPAASETCTATYTTTQDDVDDGSITNTATASGTAPSGPPPTTGPSSVTIPAIQSPAITVAKSASDSSYSAPGTIVDYRYLVTNTGNVTLTSIAVADPMLGLSSISCPSPTLLPDAFEDCTATYTTTQADVDHGNITNTGTASGQPPTGPPVTNSSTLKIPAVQNPGMTLMKTASVNTFSSAGTPITYSYDVTNTGNVTLNPVTVTDPLPGLSALTCPAGSLLPGGSETCTATYTTTQTDVDDGDVTNIGTATGTEPNGAQVIATSSVTIDAVQSPAITLAKSASLSTFAAPGLPVTYDYAVTNGGNVTLNPVTVTDPMPNLSAISCPDTSLAPAASETCTATYTTTQTDLDNGHISNTGTASGQPPTGSPVTATSSVTIPAVQGPAIGLAKSANPTSFSVAGTVITYTYQVTNSGNVTLTSVGVTDNRLGRDLMPRPHPRRGTNRDLYRHLHHHPG